MKNSLPTRVLREHPDLDQLKRQAKELLQAFTAGDAAAVREVNAHYHDADRATFALHDAQLLLARAYGFDSWPKLKAYVDGVTVKRLEDAVGRRTYFPETTGARNPVQRTENSFGPGGCANESSF